MGKQKWNKEIPINSKIWPNLRNNLRKCNHTDRERQKKNYRIILEGLAPMIKYWLGSALPPYPPTPPPPPPPPPLLSPLTWYLLPCIFTIGEVQCLVNWIARLERWHIYKQSQELTTLKVAPRVWDVCVCSVCFP